MGRYDKSDNGDDPFEIGEVSVTAETAKAILCVPESGEQFWVPKSCVHDDSEAFKKGDSGKLVVKTWWAEKNGHG